MKKLIPVLVLMFCYIGAKAQTPKIKISYDDNGNRILREYVTARPAPPPVIKEEDGSVATDGNVASLTDLVDLAGNSLKIYPNPSKDYFNVVVSEGILNRHAQLVLVDQLGREHQRIAIKGTTTTIDTKGMADGVYSIIVQYGTTKSTTRIVKYTN